MPTFNEAERAHREHSNANTSLLKLPAELRNHIYSYVLPDWSEYRIGGLIHREILRSSIMHTSRQLRQEAASLFYGQGHFVYSIPPLSHGPAWLRTLSVDCLALTRRFSFDAIVKYNRHRGGTNRVETGLHRLTITIERSDTGFRCDGSCDGSCGKGASICPAMAVISKQAAMVFEHLRTTCDEGKAFQKEDLFKMMDILERNGIRPRSS